MIRHALTLLLVFTLLACPMVCLFEAAMAMPSSRGCASCGCRPSGDDFPSDGDSKDSSKGCICDGAVVGSLSHKQPVLDRLVPLPGSPLLSAPEDDPTNAGLQTTASSFHGRWFSTGRDICRLTGVLLL